MQPCQHNAPQRPSDIADGTPHATAASRIAPATSSGRIDNPQAPQSSPPSNKREDSLRSMVPIIGAGVGIGAVVITPAGMALSATPGLSQLACLAAGALVIAVDRHLSGSERLGRYTAIGAYSAYATAAALSGGLSLVITKSVPALASLSLVQAACCAAALGKVGWEYLKLRREEKQPSQAA